MDDHASFIAAIRAEPDEDLPRLAFADWLQDRGEHWRPEFIRFQVERFRLPVRRVLKIISSSPGFISHSSRDEISYNVIGRIADGEDLKSSSLGVIFDIEQHLSIPHHPEARSPQYHHGAYLRHLATTGNNLWMGDFVVTGNRCPYRERAKTMIACEDEILRTVLPGDSFCNGYRWTEPLHRLELQRMGWDGHSHWERGFLRSFSVHPKDWIEYGDGVLAEIPLRHLRLTEFPDVEVKEDPADQLLVHWLRLPPKKYSLTISRLEMLYSVVSSRGRVYKWVRDSWEDRWPNMVVQLPPDHEMTPSYAPETG